MKTNLKQTLRSAAMIIVGSAVFALGFDLFLEPGGINSGGVSGIAMLIVYGLKPKHLTVGILSALMNIPLFFCGYRKIGKGFFFGSLLGMLASSLFFDLFAAILPVPQVEPLVACIFGGAAVGLGLALVFLGGASTGGIDIVARLIKLRLRSFPIGKIILAFDLCTAIATGVIYGQVQNTLYSALALFLSSVVLDKVIYSMDYAKVALIISDRYDEIALEIDKALDRGVTLLQGQGQYKRSDKYILLSAVRKGQLGELKSLVYGIDPNAFVILQDAVQVLGDGFKRYDRFEL